MLDDHSAAKSGGVPDAAGLPDAVRRLVTATNSHDLDGIVDCFAADYVNLTPAHPQRGFTGRGQVRRNWTAIFAAVPDVAATVTDWAREGPSVWTEWTMRGTRRDGTAHAMCGVIVFGLRSDRIASARFYLEPVDGDGRPDGQGSDADAAPQAVLRGAP